MTRRSEAVAAAPAGRRRVTRSVRLPEAAETVLVLALVVTTSEVLSRTLLAGSFALAAPTQILSQLVAQWPLYAANVGATLQTALKGFVLGNAVAVAAAVLIVQWPAAERPLFSAALAIYSVPIIALAPILMVLLDRPDAMVALSALAVVFTTMVATVLGLRSADPAALNVVHVLGGGNWDKLVRVRLQAALPSIFAGLRVAAPAAVLGATVGEFMGAERGLGVFIVGALSSLETTRVWTVAALATALSGGGYVLVGWIGGLLTPWVHGLTVAQASGPAGNTLRGRAGRAFGFAWATLVSVAVVFGGWALFIALSGLNGFFAKAPMDVWTFLFHAPDAQGNRALVFGGLYDDGQRGSRLRGGDGGRHPAAIVFVLRPSIERAVMPVAITLRSIPILATTPLVILLLGRTLTATTVIIAILSFFPTMINMVLAMRLTRRPIVELMQVLNASRLSILWRAELPSALPALLASARVAVPASILGAVVIEWLVTGVGMGNATSPASTTQTKTCSGRWPPS